MRSDLTFEITGELLSLEQVLGGQFSTGPEHQRHETQEVSQQGKRRRSTVGDDTVLSLSECWRWQESADLLRFGVFAEYNATTRIVIGRCSWVAALLPLARQFAHLPPRVSGLAPA
jgi:hypothetical protein